MLPRRTRVHAGACAASSCSLTMPATMPDRAPSHSVAVIGGAVAGAEVAGALAERGARVAVIEQNPRPYGKIEDGLPRWHVALRRKEYETIGEKLSRPNVDFVPLTSIGRDVGFRELTRDWGFSAVVLACGAWRDRPLPVEGADAYVGRGLIYQNPFIIWFNHANEKAYRGPVFEPRDGAIVVGGGLASIDVVKVLMLETTRAKLRERGIEVGDGRARGEGDPEDPRRPRPRVRGSRPRGLHALLPPARRGHAAGRDPRRRDARARGQGAREPRQAAREGDGEVPLPGGAALHAGRSDRGSGSPRGPPLPPHDRRRRQDRSHRRDLRSARPLRDQLDREHPRADRGDRDQGRAVPLHGLGAGPSGRPSECLLRGQRGDGQGQHRGLAQARGGGREPGRRGDREAPARERRARSRGCATRVQERQRAVGYTGDYASWMAKVTPPDLE